MVRHGVAEMRKPTSTSRRYRQACGQLYENLEPRILLSVGDVAQHYFSLASHGNGGVVVNASTSNAGALSPTQVRNAYGMNLVTFGSLTGDGAGQTIAIVDAYDAPNIVQDLHTFDVAYGLADPMFTKVNQNGSTSTLPAADTANRGNSWALESSLDVEWAHAMAPKANIILVEANSSYYSDLLAAVDWARTSSAATVISMSWGGSESSSDSSMDYHFTTPAGHNGVTFIASSGDSGAGVESPASSPNILAVGGTTLSTNTAGAYLGESAWSGSGGGLSAYRSQPSYQRGIVTQSTTRRAVPDVAADANPSTGVGVVDSWDGSTSAPWFQVGGTSLSAPLWAGIIAVADQGRVASGLGTLDGATGTLPAIYALPAADFHDITTGSNGYAATTGYDLVTGRGTPIANLVIAGLVGNTPAPTPTPVIGSFAVSPASVTAGTSVTLTASSVTESGGSISMVQFYRETNASAGLQIGADTLLGNGTANGTTYTLAFSTTGLAAGTYTFYAVATDAAGKTSSTASAVLTVTVPVTAPVNDLFANATVLTGTSLRVTGTNVNASRESGEPLIAGNIGGKSVWWTWTAPAGGKVTITTAGSSFDTMLGVYTGSAVNALALVASNDDVSRNNLTSSVSFTATKGVIYRIAVDGYNGASGSIVLNLTAPAAPANDLFANATAITGSTFRVTGSNVGATVEAGEPVHAGVPGGASVWFTWTATTSRTVTLSTAGSNFDTVLAVYTGSALGGLTTVAANDDAGGGLTSQVSFTAVAGQTYRIAVDGYGAATGSIVLSLT